MIIDTGYRPHRYQQEVHNNLKRFSVLVCHRRWGKTFLAVNTLVDAALRTTKEDARYGYVAPFLKQARMVAWDYLRKFAAPVPDCTIREGDLSIEFPNGARIRLFGSDNDQAMRGIYLDGVVIDEVADCRPETWPEVVRPALADRRGWSLFIGTPKGINQFHELYQHALNHPDWYGGMYRVDETEGLIHEEELELAKDTMSDNQFRQEFLCDFAAAVDNALITIDEASTAASRSKKAEELRGLPKIIGVDVARYGDDRSVIQRRWGPVALEPIVFKDIDNMALASRVMQEIETWRPDAVFIDAGRGEGVIDRCRQMGFQVSEVNFGGRPNSERHKNKRAEMWENMAIWLRSGGCIPNNSELKSDLCTPTYGFDPAQRLVLESKDKIKERGMRSPDLADALALTFAEPVMAKEYAATGQHFHKAKTSYDLFATA